jgi:hypothetical protein
LFELLRTRLENRLCEPLATLPELMEKGAKTCRKSGIII